jgi:hypothetical protein
MRQPKLLVPKPTTETSKEPIFRVSTVSPLGRMRTNGPVIPAIALAAC